MPVVNACAANPEIKGPRSYMNGEHLKRLRYTEKAVNTSRLLHLDCFVRQYDMSVIMQN